MKTALSFFAKYIHLTCAIVVTLIALPIQIIRFFGDLLILIFDREYLLPDLDYHFFEPIQNWLWKYKGYTLILFSA